MKKIISGKMYNTETAKNLTYWSNEERGFSYLRECLYLKKTGEYFLHSEGGPRTKCSVKCGQNCYTGGELITPLT